jgi:hypothetical protein
MSSTRRSLVSRTLLSVILLCLPALALAAGWDWKSPTPSGNNLNAVAMVSATEAFAVGDAGTILRYDGEQWQPEISNTNANLFDVWAASATDVFVAGYDVLNDLGLILHYDGERWQQQVIGLEISMGRVWGRSETDVFSLGITNSGASFVFRYDGNDWTEFYMAPGGTIFHYDGISWSEQHQIANSSYANIDGSSWANMVAVGRASVLARYDGEGWEDVFKSDWYFSLSGVWGFSASDVFLVGLDGAEGKGVILHYDGSGFALQLSVDHVSFGDIWGSSNTDVFASGYDIERERGVVYHYDGNQWTEQYVTADDDSLFRVWGTSGTDVFVVGQTQEGEDSVARVHHYDGVAWGVQYTDPEPRTFFNGVWGTSSSDVFAVGGVDARQGGGYEGFVFHYDGATWTEQYRVADLTFVDIWGSSGSDIFTVGHNNFDGLGSVFHYDGTQWQPQYETPAGTGEIFLLSVWGSSGSDVYTSAFVRQTNALLHFDGQGWSFVPGGVFSPVLQGIWGASANDVFVVGSQGAVLHFDGNGLVEAAPEQQAGVTLSEVNTSSVSLSSAELAQRYGTPSHFVPTGDALSVSTSILPAGLVGTFRFRVTDVGGSVSKLILYKLSNSGEPLRFEYADAANSFDDGLWWLTDEDGAYPDTGAVLEADRAYFVNFAIQDNGAGAMTSTAMRVASKTRWCWGPYPKTMTMTTTTGSAARWGRGGLRPLACAAGAAARAVSLRQPEEVGAVAISSWEERLGTALAVARVARTVRRKTVTSCDTPCSTGVEVPRPGKYSLLAAGAEAPPRHPSLGGSAAPVGTHLCLAGAGKGAQWRAFDRPGLGDATPI